MSVPQGAHVRLASVSEMWGLSVRRGECRPTRQREGALHLLRVWQRPLAGARPLQARQMAAGLAGRDLCMPACRAEACSGKDFPEHA